MSFMQEFDSIHVPLKKLTSKEKEILRLNLLHDRIRNKISFFSNFL